MRGFVVSFSSEAGAKGRKIRVLEAKPGVNLVDPVWLNHNSWVLLEDRRKSPSNEENPTRPAAAAR